METGMAGAIGQHVLLFMLDLEVRHPDGQTYRTNKSAGEKIPELFTVPLLYADYVKKVGNIVPVLIHPENRELIRIDMEKIERQEARLKSAEATIEMLNSVVGRML